MKPSAMVCLAVAFTALTAQAQFIGDTLAAAGFAEMEGQGMDVLAAIAANRGAPMPSGNQTAPPQSGNVSAPSSSASTSAPQLSANTAYPQQLTPNLRRPQPGEPAEPQAAATSATTTATQSRQPMPAGPATPGVAFSGSGVVYGPQDAAAWKAAFVPVGGVVDALPADSETVTGPWGSFGYSKGVFYQPQGKRWIVVPAPVGARVKDRPAGGSGIVHANVPYTYYNGAFYRYNKEAGAMDVVAAPLDATVTNVPATAVKQTRNGQPCYVYGETCFRPAFRGTLMVYVVS